MINVIFNQFDYEISAKKQERFEKYNKVIQWGRRNPVKFMELFFNLEFTDHQKYILLSTWYTERATWLMSRNSGKALSINTPIYCVSSDRGDKYIKKTIGDLKVGDQIYDETGNLTEVIHLNPIVIEDVYEVEFEDGEIVECNIEHLWSVYDRTFNKCRVEKVQCLRNTGFLYDNFKLVNSKNGKVEYRFYVPLMGKYDRLPEGTSKTVKQKAIIDVRKTGKKKAMRCITVSNDSGLFLCGDKFTVTHNSYLSSPYIMARSILIPNHKTYILCPAGNQAQETFGKMEDLAKDNIASVSGATSVFWDELIRANGTSDGFVHDKTSHHCELYNGSEVSTVNSVPKNIVGIRLKKKVRFKTKSLLYLCFIIDIKKVLK